MSKTRKPETKKQRKEREIALQNHIEDALGLVQGQLLSLFHNSPKLVTQKNANRLQQLLSITAHVFFQKQIYLSIPGGIEDLQSLLIDTIRGKKSDAQFEAELVDQWVPDYLALERSVSAIDRKNAAQQGTGLVRCLRDFGMDSPLQVLGNDFDIRVILKDVMSYPEDVKENGIYLLPPVSITEGRASSREAEKEHPILDHIETVLKNNPAKDVTLLVHVNAGQSHWMVAEIHIQNGKIIDTLLTDPSNNNELKGTPAYLNLQASINQINKKYGGKNIVARAIATGRQQHDPYCMDHANQIVLNRLDKRQVNDAGLNYIRDAAPDSVRKASIAKIDNRVFRDNMRKISDEKVRTAVNKAFEKPITSSSTHSKDEIQKIQDNVHQMLGDDKATKEMRSFQIEFDEAFARELDKLERRATVERKDESPAKIKARDQELMMEAFVKTYDFFHNRFTLFRPADADKKEIPSLTISNGTDMDIDLTSRKNKK